MSETHLILCSGRCGTSTEALLPPPAGSVEADDSYLSPFPPLLGSVCVKGVEKPVSNDDMVDMCVCVWGEGGVVSIKAKGRQL